MTRSTSPFMVTSEPIDTDTAARVALAIAGLSGNPSVTIGMNTIGGAAALVAAVHDREDAAIPLSLQTRARIRSLATASRVARVLEATAAAGAQLVTPECDVWPSGLADLGATTPIVLWARGNTAALLAPSIAITGSAAPSAHGIHMAIELGTGLASRGWGIAASTGAGVDQLALRAADAMHGSSIAISSSPLDAVSEIPGVDVVVSELPPATVVSLDSQRRAKHLLGAFAAKTIVIEGAPGSGPIRTAEAAHALGRPIGVIPAIDEQPDGGTALADKHGARLVLTIRDADRLH